MDSKGQSVFVLSVTVAILSVVIFTIWAAIPLLNTISNIPENIVYWMLLLMGSNVLIPFALLASLAEPKQIARADVHILLTWIVLIIDIIALVILFGVLLLFTNTNLSGDLPVNDYRWCCAFFGSDLCPNSVACDPNVQVMDLIVNAEFKAHLGFVIVFLVLAVLNLGINRLIRVNNIVQNTSQSVTDGYYVALIYVIVFMFVYIAWATIPLLNTLHVYGYPRFAIPPTPNEFVDLRYTFQYWLIFILATNVATIYLFFSAVTISEGTILQTFYLYLTPLWSIASGVIGLILLGFLLFSCNSSFSGGSICNDHEYCCKFFAQSIEYCANVTPCPGIQGQSLAANAEFIAHIVFSFLFAALQAVGLWVYYRMRVYGVFF